MRVLADADLTGRNTLALPARARELVEIGSLPELDVVRRHHPDGPALVLGGGSNLVLAGDVDGLVLVPNFSSLHRLPDRDGGRRLRVGAGWNWHALVRWTLAQGLPGLENLALIPGSVGAAPIQNIGAYGVELAEFCEAVWLYDWRDGLLRVAGADCRFAYRDSAFKRWPRPFVVLAVDLRLPEDWCPRLEYPGLRERLDGAPTAAEVATTVEHLRRQKLPDPAVEPNAGSFFVNPVLAPEAAAALRARAPSAACWPLPDGSVKFSAAWLIEACGLKGWQSGPVGVSARHALVLVHHGGGDGRMLLALAARVQATVRARFGVALAIEPVVWPPTPG